MCSSLPRLHWAKSGTLTCPFSADPLSFIHWLWLVLCFFAYTLCRRKSVYVVIIIIIMWACEKKNCVSACDRSCCCYSEMGEVYYTDGACWTILRKVVALAAIAVVTFSKQTQTQWHSLLLCTVGRLLQQSAVQLSFIEEEGSLAPLEKICGIQGRGDSLGIIWFENYAVNGCDLFFDISRLKSFLWSFECCADTLFCLLCRDSG